MTTEMKPIVGEEVVTAIKEENKVNHQLNQTNFEFVAVVDYNDVDLSKDEHLYELFTSITERYLENNLSGITLNFLYKGKRNMITLYRYGIEPEEVKHDFVIHSPEHIEKLYKFFNHAFKQVKYINDVTHLYTSSENSVTNYIKANNTEEAFSIISEYAVNNIDEANIKVIKMTKNSDTVEDNTLITNGVVENGVLHTNGKVESNTLIIE